jgi:CBS domain-containing protein
VSLARIGSRSVATVPESATVADVARLMEERNVGSVVIVEGGRAVGIVTDRDLVLRVLRRGSDPRGVRAAAVASTPVVTVTDESEPMEAAARMGEKGVRRLPVVGRDGALLGIVTLDDLIHHVGREGGELAEVVASIPVPHEGG